MEETYICDAVRTPFGRYGGALAGIRTDDLAALPIKALMERNAAAHWSMLDDVVYGCANQAGEDNRNVARMALLLAGLRRRFPATTVNRLCGSSMDAVAMAARAIKCGEISFAIAGGVESMSARSLRSREGRFRFLTRRKNRRHHDRLAFHQSPHEGEVRRRFHAGNRRECG